MDSYFFKHDREICIRFQHNEKSVEEERQRDKMIFQRNTEDPSKKLAASFNISCLPG